MIHISLFFLNQFKSEEQLALTELCCRCVTTLSLPRHAVGSLFSSERRQHAEETGNSLQDTRGLDISLDAEWCPKAHEFKFDLQSLMLMEVKRAGT